MTRRMSAEAKAKKNARSREWRLAHPYASWPEEKKQKHRAANNAAKSLAWREANPEKVLANAKLFTKSDAYMMSLLGSRNVPRVLVEAKRAQVELTRLVRKKA